MVKNLLTSFTGSIDRIDLRFPSFSISGVYAAPSLDNSIPFREKVAPLSAAGCSIGDYNTRFNAQGVATPSMRGTMLGDTISSLGLRFLIPFNKPSSLDCAMCPDSWAPALSALPAPLDIRPHPLLSLFISPPPLPSPTPPSTLRTIRFHMAALDDPRTISRFCDAFEAGAPALLGLLDSLATRPPVSPAARAAIVSHLDELLRGLVEDAATHYLGVYSPEVARPTQIRRPRPFDPSDLASPLREWKRFCRSSRPAPLVSGSPTTSAWEDTIDFFSKSFGQDAEVLLPPPHLMEGDRLVAAWFSAASLHSFFSSYSKAKSCGIDGMHAKILWCLCSRPPEPDDKSPDLGLPPTDFRQVTAAFFRLCALWGCTPASWNVAVTHLLPKPGKPRTAAGSRPISLTSMFRRAFEKILLRGMCSDNWSREECNDFSPTQGGFRRGHSARAHLALASDIFHSGSREWIFLDISAAYDRVPLGTLFAALQRRLDQVPYGLALISLLHSLFVECGCSVVVNGALTPTIRKTRGLFQGSVLAPWLFNVFIDPLARLLDNGFPGPTFPRSLFFADDIALCPASADQGSEMVEWCAQWLEGYNMSLSPSKCASSFLAPVLLHDAPLPHVDPVKGYPYLGVPFVPDKGFLFARAVDSGVAAADKALQSLTAAGNGWGPRTRLDLYRAFVRSRWEYALPLLAASLPIPTSLDFVANRFSALEDRAAIWCAAPLPAGRLRTSRFLLGLPPPTLRVQHLLICWTFEGNNLALNHPIRRLPPWPHAVYHNGPRPPSSGRTTGVTPVSWPFSASARTPLRTLSFVRRSGATRTLYLLKSTEPAPPTSWLACSRSPGSPRPPALAPSRSSARTLRSPPARRPSPNGPLRGVSAPLGSSVGAPIAAAPSHRRTSPPVAYSARS